MRRREFIAGLGGAAAWPLVVRAQQPAMPVIGWLNFATPDPFAFALAGFRQGLKEAGYVEGQNLAIEYRWANNEVERLPGMAADLVRRQVAVIVAAGSGPAALAAKAATATIPIVVVFGGDPVKYGLVASLNRPGGNVTAVTSIGSELKGKRLDLLRAMLPQATTVGFLHDPRMPLAEESTSEILAAARALGWQVIVVEARSDRDLEAAFATFVERRAGALVVNNNPLLDANRERLVALAARHKIPTIYTYRESTLAGGLMSYGASNMDLHRLGGVYAGRILKGDKPADLPVQQSTRFEFVINLKTAKTLGLTIPETLLATADEVIQ